MCLTGLFTAEHCAKGCRRVEMMKARQPQLPGEGDRNQTDDHGCDTREPRRLLQRNCQEDRSDTRIVKKMAFIKDARKGVKGV